MILDIIQILPEIYLSMAVIFSRMGSGSQSGKLLFKELFSGTNVTIEDGISSITISATGSIPNQPITANEIVYGRGSELGLTSSSLFKAFNIVGSETVCGFGTVQSNSSDCNYNGSSIENSFITGGFSNEIRSDSHQSQIIGGRSNLLRGTQNNDSSIIGGNCNCSYESRCSVIISGRSNFNDRGLRSSILGSYGSCNIQSSISSIISSGDSIICGMYKHNSIISSLESRMVSSYEGITGSIHNIILSSFQSEIFLDSTSLTSHIKYNFIGGSHDSCIFGVSGSNDKTDFSTIISSRSSKIMGNFSTIIDSSLSCIISAKDQPFHTIIGGFCNTICANLSKNTSIIGSKCSCIFGTRAYSVSILASYKSCNLCATCNSSILGGCCNIISGNYNNIIGGFENTLSPNSNSTIIGGQNNTNNNPGIGGAFSYESGFGLISGCGITSSFINLGGSNNVGYSLSITLGGCRNISGKTSIIGAYPNCSELSRYHAHSTIMVGGFENRSGSNFSGIILGGGCNQLLNTCNTSIIGGRCNIILGKGMFMYTGEYFGPNTVYDSFILGGGCNKFGALSYLTYNPTGARRIKNSGIIGGCCNNIYSCNPGPYLGLSDLDRSIIVGGCGITASSPGMHVQNLLVCGIFKTRNSNYSCVGFSGTVANPTSIRVVNGLIVNVT